MVRILLLIFFLLPGVCFGAPLNLDVEKTYTTPPVIKNFRHWFGSIEYGWIYYLAENHIAGFETELHLQFAQKKIIYALLIFGPAGMDQDNCVKKYKKVIKNLNKKYGHYKFMKQTKDPIVEDLIVMSPCHPFRIGAYELNTHWLHKDGSIISSLLGDNDGYYIETEYFFNKDSNHYDNVLKSAL